MKVITYVAVDRVFGFGRCGRLGAVIVGIIGEGGWRV